MSLLIWLLMGATLLALVIVLVIHAFETVLSVKDHVSGDYAEAERRILARHPTPDSNLSFAQMYGSTSPILCEGCKRYYADPLYRLCPGCEAYQEHQR